MIDRPHQGRGYGTEAIRLILEDMKSRFGCREIYLSTDPENKRGLHLYHKFGFRETGETDDDEIILNLTL